jgi:hypothetical protein
MDSDAEQFNRIAGTPEFRLRVYLYFLSKVDFEPHALAIDTTQHVTTYVAQYQYCRWPQSLFFVCLINARRLSSAWI